MRPSFVSARAMSADKKRTLAAGCDGYLVEPIVKEFPTEVARLLVTSTHAERTEA